MVLTPALIVPDEATWTAWGDDPAARGLEPAPSPTAARAVLAPERLPASLAGALLRALHEAVRAPDVVLVPGPFAGAAPFAEAMRAAAGEDGGDDGHGDHAGHDDMDHDDMMAITGEPSADGLVMETIDLEHGPLAPGLPGGLTVAASLDGDVVERCEVRATLFGPDLLAPAARAAAEPAGAPPADLLTRVAAVERERALSHLAWLRALGRLLGWAVLVKTAQRALDALSSGDLRVARDHAARAAERVTTSRTLDLRAAGLAVVTAGEARAAGLRGPNARAAGVQDDAREGDPLYARLGFAPTLERAGDARARVVVRAREAVAALDLAAAARATRLDALGDRAPAVEGPRGALTADGGTAGQEAARRLAADRSTGLEWSAALLAIASFDLSPWKGATS